MSDEQLDEALLALWEYSRRAPARRRTRLRELRRWRSRLPRRSPSLLPRPSADRIENDPLYAATRCKSSMIFRRLALIS
jgi:hypothetical protein